MKRAIQMTINGEPYAATVEHRLLLVDFIREVACLTGTHIGCGFEGRCGACSVIVNGDAIKSCLMLAVQADGAEVYTIEGLAQRDALHPLLFLRMNPSRHRPTPRAPGHRRVPEVQAAGQHAP